MRASNGRFGSGSDTVGEEVGIDSARLLNRNVEKTAETAGSLASGVSSSLSELESNVASLSELDGNLGHVESINTARNGINGNVETISGVSGLNGNIERTSISGKRLQIKNISHNFTISQFNFYFL